MKPRTVIILWAIAIVLGIAAYFVKFQSNDNHSLHTKLTPGEKLLPNLPIREFASITLQQGQDTTTITRGENNLWHVNQRSDYPANHELLRNLLGALGEIKVSQGYPCSAQHYGRFGVAEKSDEESDLGLKVTMTDADGTKTSELYLGKYNGSSQTTMGRFIRLEQDDSGVYVAGETFPGVYADAPAWLDKQFLNVQNIQSISLNAPNDPDFTPWEVARSSPAANAQFQLVGMTDQETMKLTSTGALRTLLAHASFQDVLNDKKAEETATPNSKLKREAIIQTFDGLTYTVTFWPQKSPNQPEADPESPLPAVQAAYLFTVSLQVNLASARTPTADETPENAQKLDDAFLDRQQQLKALVSLVKGFEGRIYQVGHTLLQPLQKSRTDFISVKKSVSSP